MVLDDKSRSILEELQYRSGLYGIKNFTFGTAVKNNVDVIENPPLMC